MAHGCGSREVHSIDRNQPDNSHDRKTLWIESKNAIHCIQVTPTDTPINHGIFLESVALAPLYAVTMPFIVSVLMKKKKSFKVYKPKFSKSAIS